MSKWQRKLDIKAEWTQCSNGDITRIELAKAIHRKLGALRPFGDLDLDGERDYLLDNWKDLIKEAEDAGEDIPTEEFDYLMESLYNWGDTEVGRTREWPPKKACWIATEF